MWRLLPLMLLVACAPVGDRATGDIQALDEPVTFGHGQIVDAPFSLVYERLLDAGKETIVVRYAYSGTATLTATNKVLVYELMIETADVDTPKQKFGQKMMDSFRQYGGVERLPGHTLKIVSNREAKAGSEDLYLDGALAPKLNELVVPFGFLTLETTAGETVRPQDEVRPQRTPSDANAASQSARLSVLGKTTFHSRSVIVLQYGKEWTTDVEHARVAATVYYDTKTGFAVFIDTSKTALPDEKRGWAADLTGWSSNLRFEVRP